MKLYQEYDADRPMFNTLVSLVSAIKSTYPRKYEIEICTRLQNIVLDINDIPAEVTPSQVFNLIQRCYSKNYTHYISSTPQDIRIFMITQLLNYEYLAKNYNIYTN